MEWSRACWWFGTGLFAISLQMLWSLINAIRTRWRNQLSLNAFPGPPAHWFLGVMPQIRGPDRSLVKTTEWMHTYGDVYSMWFSFSQRVLRLTGPDAVQIIFNTAEPKGEDGNLFMEPWIGDGLLISQGKKWARNRRLLTPAFHFDILKPYVRIFSESTNVMLDKWQSQAEGRGSTTEEVFEDVSLMTLDSLMKCIFDIHDQDIQIQGRTHPYILSVYKLSEMAIERFHFPPYHSDFLFALSPAGFKFRKHVNVAHKFTRDVIKARKKDGGQKQMSKEDRKYLSFMEILLDCKDADGKGLSHQEICDEVDTFMFAGHDTTASGISWFLYNLARHPNIQQKCRDEVNSVLGSKHNVEWSDISKFEYLAQCLKESLRLHPPVPAIGRTTTKPITLSDGRHIPKGTRLTLGIYNVHHNKRVWKNPDVYDPERFNPENSKHRHPHAFVPFAAGPRNCIGQHFAKNEMKTCVAQILRRFELSLDEFLPAPTMTAELILRTKNGLWLKCTPIKQ